MLIDIEVAIQASAPRSSNCVRIWLDPEPDAGLQTEVEALLHPRGHARWVGTVDIPATARSRYFLYRLALRAAPRTAWALSLSDRESGRALLSDSDLVELPKTWVVGTCSLAKDEARGGARPSICESVLEPVARPRPRRGSLVLAHSRATEFSDAP